MNDNWTTNDPSLYLPPNSRRDPNYVATLFLSGLLGDVDLDDLVTPQARDAWGKFTDARQYLRALDAPGVSTGNTRAEGARDVAYVALLTGVGAGYVLPAATKVDADVVTLVWHHPVDSWLVHSIGEPVQPDIIDRPSIGTAPERA